MKLVLVLIFCNILSANAKLEGYFSSNLAGKNFHFYLSDDDSYAYQSGDPQVYFLKKDITLANIQTYQIYESANLDTVVGKVKINNDLIEEMELNKLKAKKAKLKKLAVPIQEIDVEKQIFNNGKCSFKFINLKSIENAYLFKKTSYLISEIMDAFKDYDCDYLKSNQADTMDDKLNQLVCENETIILKERFFGITFKCKASLANAKDYQYQVFSLIFDSILKAKVSMSDFTSSDISSEDDNKNLAYRLTPVGLGLFSADMVQNKQESLRILPYFNIKKNFSVWGQPKRYVNYFSLK